MRITLGAVIALALAVLAAGAHDHSRARAQKQEATIEALLKNVRLVFPDALLPSFSLFSPR